MVINNQVRAFIEQETLSIAMEIGYQEAMDFWLEVWRAVELCMVFFNVPAIWQFQEFLEIKCQT